jgi:squalene-hopene/tetraprenyl-beta-curcumene cyclase
VGRLSNSALSTATATSALALVAANTSDDSRRRAGNELAARGIAWLAGAQNDDGGWGDTDRSTSNIATTMLVQAAFHLAGAAEANRGLLTRAKEYIDRQGGTEGLRRRYGVDKTFAVPILTNCALAGLVPWGEVAPLPFELAALPFPMLRFLRLPVVSYAVPALVAIGQARFFHQRPRNPLVWLLRRCAVWPSMKALTGMQPASGGYLEAAPLTSFVVMSLAATGRADHPVARRGIRFLLDSVREDGSWPIDTNLATWNTTLSVQALAAATGEVGALGCIDWLLDCQYDARHPFTNAAPGGWAWSDASGAVPDADDTAGALMALAVLERSASQSRRERIRTEAAEGVRWLLDLQNRDGGWPTFCRGWGTLPFDRSGADLTAHAIRALATWAGTGAESQRIGEAISAGFDFLSQRQRPDGSWVPLWFGNQHHPEEENPVFGTTRVLLAYRDLGKIAGDAAQRGLQWLCASRCVDGGWGCGLPDRGESSIEETALAIDALLSDPDNPALRPVLEDGLAWLIRAVEEGRHRQAAPIGLYFARLWYYECLYPMIFTVSALGRAVRVLDQK